MRAFETNPKVLLRELDEQIARTTAELARQLVIRAELSKALTRDQRLQVSGPQ